MYINTTTGEYPVSYNELKKRFPNTSFPSTFLPEEHEEYRLVHVSDSPNHNQDNQRVVEDAPVLSNGKYVQKFRVETQPEQDRMTRLRKAKSKRIAQATAKRYEVEVSHPTIDTSRASQAMLTGMWVAMQIAPQRVINFKQADGSWVSVDKDAFDAVAASAINWVEDCFDNEKQLHDQINAATTLSAVLALDIDSGWPS